MEEQIHIDDKDIINKLIAQRDQNANEAAQAHAVGMALQRKLSDRDGTISGLKGVIAANAKRIEEMEAQLAAEDVETEELNAAPLPIEKDANSSPA